MNNYRPQSLSGHNNFIFRKLQTDMFCKHFNHTHSLPVIPTDHCEQMSSSN